MAVDAKKLLEGITPGPWHFRLEAARTVIYHKPDIGERAIAVGAGHYPDHVANARLIAAAPQLAERVVELEGENARLREALDWAKEQFAGELNTAAVAAILSIERGALTQKEQSR